ncbi:hypothetical protein U9M48_030155 [Paspalum notatum var. saurae]|uniref:WAT1-related protein n=1 Tax=Paspalum notatum var. saurae TaxID=547442 RepID=A0AAQ3U4E1_PASNO
MADEEHHHRHHAVAAARRVEVVEEDIMVVPIKTPAARAAALETVALPLSMVMVQVFTVGMLLLSKLALNTGMRPCVLIVYRNLIATVFIAPLAFIFERVVLGTGLYYYGLQTTDAAYSVTFLNLIPIVTFVIAIMVRAEKLAALGSWPGMTKLLGALTCVGGTMVLSLLKGPLLHLWPTHLLKNYSHAPPAASNHGSGMVAAGTLFLCGSCLGYALWFIVQSKLGKVFPSRYWATMLTCLSGSLQSLVIGGTLLSHDRADWRLKWDLQLLTVVYSGVFNTGITFVLVSWVVSRRGPIYPSMFNSVSLILTMVMDSLLLGTNIYVAGVVGALLIIVGLYAFLWGKNKELVHAAAAKKRQQEEEQIRRGGVGLAAGLA